MALQMVKRLLTRIQLLLKKGLQNGNRPAHYEERNAWAKRSAKLVEAIKNSNFWMTNLCKADKF